MQWQPTVSFATFVSSHKANDGVVRAIRAWFQYDTALSGMVVQARTAYWLNHSISPATNTADQCSLYDQRRWKFASAQAEPKARRVCEACV